MNIVAFFHARDMAKNIFLYNLKHVTHEHYGVVPMFRVFSLRVNRSASKVIVPQKVMNAVQMKLQDLVLTPLSILRDLKTIKID